MDKLKKVSSVRYDSFSVVISPRKVFRFLLIAVLIISFLSAVGYFSRYIFGNGRLLGIGFHFNLDKERNFATLFSACLILTASMLLLLIAIAKTSKSSGFRYHWSFLSVIFAYISLDEVFEFHEQVKEPLIGAWGAVSWFYFAWVIPGIFLLVILSVIFFKFYLHLPRPSRINFGIAGTLYIGGALIVEMIGANYAYHYGVKNLAYGLITTFEETLELLGMSLFIFSLLGFFKRNISSNIVFKLEDK